MNFASFNPIQTQQTNIVQNQPLTLKKGQILQGTIKKLYPDQIVEIQVGGHRLLAKLETPLKAGDSHFFQVTSISPQAELKVVTGPMNASTSMKQQIHQLLDSMNLPKTAEMMQLVSHFIKEQVPISKEQLLQAQNLVNLNDNLSKQNVLNALQKMIELKMPFTNEVFQAIINGSKTSGFTQTIDTFTEILLKDQSITDDAKAAIIQNLEKVAKPLEAHKGELIVSRAIQSLLNESEPIANKLIMLNLLKEASILPKEATLSNWMQNQTTQIGNTTQIQSLQNAFSVIQTIRNMNREDISNILNQVKSWVQNEPNLSQAQKSEIISLINRFELMPKQVENIEQFTKQMNELLLKSYSGNITNHLYSQNSNNSNAANQLLSLLNQEAISNESMYFSNVAKIADGTQHPQMQNLNRQVEQHLKEAFNGNAIQHAVKTVLKSLGISYESTLNSQNLEIEQISEQLKPQLLSIVREGVVSPALKDAAEVLLARMNGMQLLSGENGHQHQIVMQIPLQFFGRSMDATLQWNGRMKDNGKIDSNYARILFYLDMQSLNETVVDMQVQNRIVTITLFNEFDNLSVLADPFQRILKERLLEKDYYLSGIFFKPLENNSTEPSKKKVRKDKNVEVTSGVDIRI